MRWVLLGSFHHRVWRYHNACTAQSGLNHLSAPIYELFSMQKHCIQLYLLDFWIRSLFYHMNRKDCNTCEISANQLMDECPSCGAQFEHLSTDARVYGVIALLVVFCISLLLSAE